MPRSLIMVQLGGVGHSTACFVVEDGLISISFRVAQFVLNRKGNSQTVSAQSCSAAAAEKKSHLPQFENSFDDKLTRIADSL